MLGNPVRYVDPDGRDPNAQAAADAIQHIAPIGVAAAPVVAAAGAAGIAILPGAVALTLYTWYVTSGAGAGVPAGCNRINRDDLCHDGQIAIIEREEARVAANRPSPLWDAIENVRIQAIQSSKIRPAAAATTVPVAPGTTVATGAPTPQNGGGGGPPSGGKAVYPSKAIMAKRLGVSEDKFHNKTKKDILKDLNDKKKLGKNPDIGVNEAGNISLRSVENGREIQTDVPLSTYGE